MSELPPKPCLKGFIISHFQIAVKQDIRFTHKDYGLLGHDAMQFGMSLTVFQRNIISSFCG